MSISSSVEDLTHACLLTFRPILETDGTDGPLEQTTRRCTRGGGLLPVGHLRRFLLDIHDCPTYLELREWTKGLVL